MPKGQKLIDWTPENDARLMLTILALENIHPNCEAVASAFGKPHHNHTTNPPHHEVFNQALTTTTYIHTGGAVNAMAISNRLSRLRKKAADEGLLPKGAGAAPSNNKGRNINGAAKKGKAVGRNADELLATEGSG